jgi:tetratricopeptide (TPR) repeat protein
VVWLERLEREHDNFREVLAWLLERGEAERAAQLPWHIRLYWAVRGHAAEGRLWVERARASRGPAGGARVRALLANATLLFVPGDVGRMSGLLEEAIAGVRVARDGPTLRQAMILSGYAAVFRQDLDAAEEVLSEALVMSRDRGDAWNVALALNALGQAALLRGDFERATKLLREVESVARQAKDTFTLATNLNIYAVVAQLQGDETRAAELFREERRPLGRPARLVGSGVWDRRSGRCRHQAGTPGGRGASLRGGGGSAREDRCGTVVPGYTSPVR